MRSLTRWARSWARCIGAATPLVVGGLLLGAPPAQAQVAGSCMQDVWKAHGNSQSLTCTANDVTLSSAGNLCVHVTKGGPQDQLPVNDPDDPNDNGDGCQDPNPDGQFTCVSGQSFTFTADFTMPLTAQARYDLGLYIATDGGGSDGALTGQCEANVVTGANSTTFLNKDGDICGDIDSANTPQVIRETVTVMCTDSNSDSRVDLPWCTSWRQPGANEVCDSAEYQGAGTFDAFPGSPSKCNCGTLNIDVFLETASITVDKTAAPTTVPETGGTVTYTVSVTNNALVSSVTLDSLTDDLYGDITKKAPDNPLISDTTCTLATTIPAESNDAPPPNSANPYVCTFTVAMGAANQGTTVTDTVTACGSDEFNHSGLCDDDDATVTYTDVQTDPALEKTATAVQAVQVDVQYTVAVTNHSTVDTLTLNSLLDDKFGDLSETSSSILSTDCLQLRQGTSPVTQLPVTIPPSGNYTCSFVGRFTGVIDGQHTNKVTGAATDEDEVDYPRPSPPRPDDAPDFTDTATVNVSVTIP